jgi:hypothetical protein
VVWIPAHAPLQPANVEPSAGVAVRTTPVPGTNSSEQSEPQSIPAGALTTRPAPPPATSTVSAGAVSSLICHASETVAPSQS